MALAAGRGNYHDCGDVDAERGGGDVLLAPGQECVMLAIPSDVLVCIFNCLPLRNRFLLSGVCMQMQRSMREPALWRSVNLSSCSSSVTDQAVEWILQAADALETLVLEPPASPPFLTWRLMQALSSSLASSSLRVLRISNCDGIIQNTPKHLRPCITAEGVRCRLPAVCTFTRIGQQCARSARGAAAIHVAERQSLSSHRVSPSRRSDDQRGSHQHTSSFLFPGDTEDEESPSPSSSSWPSPSSLSSSPSPSSLSSSPSSSSQSPSPSPLSPSTSSRSSPTSPSPSPSSTKCASPASHLDLGPSDGNRMQGVEVKSVVPYAEWGLCAEVSRARVVVCRPVKIVCMGAVKLEIGKGEEERVKEAVVIVERGCGKFCEVAAVYEAAGAAAVVFINSDESVISMVGGGQAGAVSIPVVMLPKGVVSLEQGQELLCSISPQASQLPLPSPQREQGVQEAGRPISHAPLRRYLEPSSRPFSPAMGCLPGTIEAGLTSKIMESKQVGPHSLGCCQSLRLDGGATETMAASGSILSSPGREMRHHECHGRWGNASTCSILPNWFAKSSLCHLEVLCLSECRWVNDYVVESLLQATGSRALREIDLSWTSVTDASLRLIPRVLAATLEKIEIVGCSLHGRKTISDAGVEALSVCSRLSSLTLYDYGAVSDQSISLVSQTCPDMRHLCIPSCYSCSDFGISLCLQKWPLLTLLDVSRIPGITDSTLESLSRSCPLLDTLKISGCIFVSDRGVRACAQGCSELTRIDVSSCPFFTDAGACAVGLVLGLTLESLDVASCSVTDAGVACLLATCVKLERLNLNGCPSVTDQSFAAIGRNAVGCHLRSVSLKGCAVSAEGIHQVLSECSLLAEIEIPPSALQPSFALEEHWVEGGWSRVSQVSDDGATFVRRGGYHEPPKPCQCRDR